MFDLIKLFLLKPRRVARLAQLWVCNFVIVFPTLLKNFLAVRSFYRKHYPNYDRRIGLLINVSIGPMAYLMELQLREAYAKSLDPKRDILWVATSRSVNAALERMLKRVANIVIDDSLYDQIQYGGDVYLRSVDRYSEDEYGNGVVKYPELPVNVDFSKEELSYGKALLAKIGVKEGGVWVPVHNKDQAYWHDVRGIGKPWDSYRDTNFQTLQKSIQFLSSKGIQVIRSGHYRPEGTGYLSLDVLSEEERAFMDLYLQKFCLFSVNGSSGIACLPYIFKTPMLFHNMIPMGENPPVENGIIIPKMIRNRRSGQWMKIRELLSLKTLIGYESKKRFIIKTVSADKWQDMALYQDHDLEIVDNSEDEILAGVQEMLQYLEGSLKLDAESLELQDRFKQSFPLSHPMRDFRGWVSPSFLSKYREILD